jgi:hypothetical protein
MNPIQNTVSVPTFFSFLKLCFSITLHIYLCPLVFIDLHENKSVLNNNLFFSVCFYFSKNPFFSFILIQYYSHTQKC